MAKNIQHIIMKAENNADWTHTVAVIERNSICPSEGSWTVTELKKLGDYGRQNKR